ncbi:hypothetical protein Phum_PHUM327740 [Pediculus humanus corporis]|uniref:Uncharacterized protein n=1 Tax=Pediculus humanus subsp. corporis TaxID=121224 RepID=E0VN29_PEDHC|nr:uncharacterized protein Phum_PHUM327740 [Pediculus humanus corporis]EEB14795.1 hypothetical protein Phum_PHUM327740 [Pediculus humanus corporis]
MISYVSLIINYILIIINLSSSTIDINLSEFQYIADHLTVEECYKLVSALHFNEFDLPKGLNAAAQLMI